MSFDLIHGLSPLAEKQAVRAIMECNKDTEKFGLVITEEQAVALNQKRNETLKSVGRIEFGGGIIDKLIYAFCDSMYIDKYQYAEQIGELTEIFYEYKNETLDMISDEEIIDFMRKSFDGVCGGSLEMLAGTTLEKMARNVRHGLAPNYEEPTIEEEEADDQ